MNLTTIRPQDNVGCQSPAPPLQRGLCQIDLKEQRNREPNIATNPANIRNLGLIERPAAARAPELTPHLRGRFNTPIRLFGQGGMGMSKRRLGLGLGAFAILSIGVGSNLMLMQSGPRAALARGGEQVAKSQRERRLALEIHKPSALDARAGNAIRPESMSADVTDQSETVRAVQRELHHRGYLAATQDGVAGFVTRAAIMAFEHDNGLPLTADPSEELLKRILLGPAAAPPPSQPARDKRGQSEMIIKTVQQTLSGLGYNTGKADGLLGEDTQRAIRDFESDNAMPESGRVSGHLVAKLAKLAGNGKLTASR